MNTSANNPNPDKKPAPRPDSASAQAASVPNSSTPAAQNQPPRRPVRPAPQQPRSQQPSQIPPRQPQRSVGQSPRPASAPQQMPPSQVPPSQMPPQRPVNASSAMLRYARKQQRKKQRGRIILLAAVVLAVIALISAAIAVALTVGGNGGEGTSGDTSGGGTSAGTSQDAADTSADASGVVGADSESEPEITERRLRFVAAGDNVMHASILNEARANAVAAAAAGQDYGDYYFDEMYTPVADIFKEADIAFINQESPIAGADFGFSGHPNFNSPEETAQTLQRLGFDIVNIANNHMLDMDTVYRGTGYQRTVDFWKTQPFTVIGGYENAEDYDNIRVHEIDGIKIALLSYTYGTNGNKLNSASPDMVVPLINDADIARQMELAKEKGDLVFVSMHWGSENTFTPSGEQKRLARLLNSLGADVIIGHHSHTVQPIEWLESTEGNRTLVYYSLGNLISTMLNSYNMVGLIAGFDIVRDSDGNISVDEATVSAEPIVCHYLADPNVLDAQGYPTRSGMVVYPLDEYTQDLASAHGSQLYGSFTLDTLRRYVTDTVDAEFLD